MKNNQNDQRDAMSQFQWEQLHGLLKLAQVTARGFQPRDDEIVDLIEHIQQANVTAYKMVCNEEVFYIPIRWEDNPHITHGAGAQQKRTLRLSTGGHGS